MLTTRSITTSIAPTAQGDDCRLALSLLFQPWRWRRGTAAEQFERVLKERIGVDVAVSFESGRTALYAILASLGISSGDEVLLQAFTCVAVADPILWTHATLVYVDCDEQTLSMNPENLQKKITPKSKVVIIQHTFGYPAPFDRLLKIANDHHLIVIEDCAHALGVKENGKPLGGFGYASIVSFGRDKSLSSTFGGAALTNDPELGARLKSFQRSLPAPSPAWIVRQLIHPLLYSFFRKTDFFFSLGKSVALLARASHIISPSVEPVEKRGGRPSFALHRFSNALARLALHQLEKLDRYNTPTRETSTLYTALIPRRNQTTASSAHQATPYLRYPILVEHPQQAISLAKSRGIELGNWYHLPVSPSGVQLEQVGYRQGSCPTAERLSAHIINLPTTIHTSPEDARAIVDVLLPAL